MGAKKMNADFLGPISKCKVECSLIGKVTKGQKECGKHVGSIASWPADKAAYASI
jgi:hypothetical protein